MSSNSGSYTAGAATSSKSRFESEITDDDLLMLASIEEPKAAAPSAPAPQNRAAIPPASVPSTFQDAFAAMTSSAMYTSPASMPPLAAQPRPGAAAVTGAAATVPKPAVTNSSFSIAAPGGLTPAQLSATKAPSAHAIQVSPRQRGNPVLSHISNVAWEYGGKDMLADYILGETCAGLYLSLKYHMLHPNYIQSRMQSVRYSFSLKLLLVYVDTEDSDAVLQEVTRLAFLNAWTLIACWSYEEIARYLETFKNYEKKTSDLIQEKIDEGDTRAKMHDLLTTIRSVQIEKMQSLCFPYSSSESCALHFTLHYLSPFAHPQVHQ
jgi:DNA excision repair protein ERCC-1